MRSPRRIAAATLGLLRADRSGRRAAVETFLLDRVVRRPIVYTDARGLRYVLHPGENAGVYIAAHGNYEQAETAFCERLLRQGDVVLDVGGNIGLYALLAAKLVGDGGRVHTFEPEAGNARRLRENIALNGFGNVEVFEVAVFSEPGTVELNVFEPGYNAWHSLGRPSLADPADPSRTVTPVESRAVPAVTLDEHCTRHGISRVDLLKIDVEGAEVDALLGATGLLETRSVTTVLFEVSLPQVAALGHSAGAAFELLARLGYDCFRLTPDGTLGERVTGEVATYANYVARPADA